MQILGRSRQTTKPAGWGSSTRRAQDTPRINCGPELRRQDQDNQQSMNVFDEDLLVESSLSDDSQGKLSDGSDITMCPEFRLRRGERYGWWHDHEQEENRKNALVHGAVNNFRTDILLDSGASVSMAKTQAQVGKQISVSGLGGVPTSITASAEVKITLGPRVVYVVDVWVANIGGGLDALLGMNFMFSAGVRLCVTEGLVQLPDEETGPIFYFQEGDYPMSSRAWLTESVYSILCIFNLENIGRLFRKLMRPSTIWAGRGDRWVTQVLYAWKVPAAIKVVIISDRIVTIEVAQVIENGFFPRAGRYVRVWFLSESGTLCARWYSKL
ncbi:hypothetical protein PHMEG_00028053 [Phytophthora megakarya]|uniref:Peptidase A2 domain-containing protein n=1 Tax=Phytophthora megakarya TaxID=4795 RepID=A0A225V5H0_9STRA|nr:hypothetical protein PHMEG_00028053 [Phytophthora megakarya]